MRKRFVHAVEQVGGIPLLSNRLDVDVELLVGAARVAQTFRCFVSLIVERKLVTFTLLVWPGALDNGCHHVREGRRPCGRWFSATEEARKSQRVGSVIDVLVEWSVVERVKARSLPPELFLNHEQELLQLGDPANCCVAAFVGGVEQQSHQVFDRRSAGGRRIDAKALLLTRKRAFDPVAGQAMVRAMQLVRANLELIEDVLVELDVQLVGLRLVGSCIAVCRRRATKPVNNPARASQWYGSDICAPTAYMRAIRLGGRRRVICAAFARGTSGGASGSDSQVSDQSRSRSASQPLVIVRSGGTPAARSRSSLVRCIPEPHHLVSAGRRGISSGLRR